MSEDMDVGRLKLAELALLSLTDECCGSCTWGRPHPEEHKCSCSYMFWPAIERVRDLIKELDEDSRHS